MEKQIYALLVGINEYPVGIRSLNGCLEDVRKIETFLKQNFGQENPTASEPLAEAAQNGGESVVVTSYDKLHICKITNANATYHNIIAGFTQFLRKAGPDDVVWFHYSGHGTEAWTADEFFETVEPGALDQVLVCHKSKPEDGQLLLADKELAALLHEVETLDVEGQAKESPHIVVSLDCCHSGTGTRDPFDEPFVSTRKVVMRKATTREEAIERSDEIRKLDDYYGYGNGKPFEGVPLSRHVFMAACQSDELAAEDPGGGAFTAALMRTLSQSGNQINYADLLMRTRAFIRKTRDKQNPQFSTYGNFNPFTRFLEGSPLGSADRYPVWFNQRLDRWQVQAGAIHGLPTQPETPIQVALFSTGTNGRKVATATITSTGAQKSTLSPLALEAGAAVSETAENLQAEITHLPVPPVFVWLHGEEPFVQKLKDNWDDSKNVQHVAGPEGEQKPMLEVHTAPDEAGSSFTHYLIKDRRSGRLLQRVPAEPDAAPTAVMDSLGKIVRWERTIELKNEQSLLLNKFDFELLVQEAPVKQQVFSAGEVLIHLDTEKYFEHIKDNGEKLLFTRFLPRVRIRQINQDLFFYLLHLRPDYSIRSYAGEIPFKMANHENLNGVVEFPIELNLLTEVSKRDPETGELVLVGKNWALSEGENEATSYFKVIASTEEIDIEQLLQDKLGGSRDDDFEETGDDRISNDWCSKTIKLTMLRQENEIPGLDASALTLANGAIEIAPHPELRAGVGLQQSGGGRRSLDPTHLFALFETEGVRLHNLATDASGVAQQVLELTNLSLPDPSVLQEDPLRLKLQLSLATNEMLLPVAFDGQHFRLIGTAEANGAETLVQLTQIPDLSVASQAGTVGSDVAEAIKIAFLIVTLPQPAANVLSVCQWEADGVVSMEPASLEPTDLAGKKVLLLIHGLAGSGRQMARQLRLAKDADGQPLLDQMDVVLAYAYEPLNELEAAAADLQAALENAGIHSGQHDRLSILAEGCGGLLARAYIEQKGGKAHTHELWMMGTPNNGIRFNQPQGLRKFAVAALDIGLNYDRKQLPYFAALLRNSQADSLPGHEQMKQGPWIQALNGSPDPGIPYHLIFGNAGAFEEEMQGFDQLMLAHGIQLANLPQGQDAFDLAVNQRSCLHKAVFQRRNPKASQLVVACHHFNYLASLAGLASLTNTELQPSPPRPGPGIPLGGITLPGGTVVVPGKKKITNSEEESPLFTHDRNALMGFGKSYAFVIGINKYEFLNSDLVSAVSDAELIAEILKTHQRFDHVLLMKDATGDEMRELVRRMAGEEATPLTGLWEDAVKQGRIHWIGGEGPENLAITHGDSLVFYYAGHGRAGEFDQGPAGFFLPADARPHSASLDHSSLVPMDEVFHTLSEKVNCHHSLLILDCCFAGKFRFVGNKSRAEDFEEVAPTTNLRFARYKEKSAWQVLVSAGPDETAADWMGTRINRDDWGEEIRGFHSPFAVALIRGLRGQADAVFPARESGDGVITMQELYLYIWDQLDDMIRGSGFELQHPGLFPMGQHGGGTFVFFNPEHEEIKIELDPVPTNPYKGLSAFMEDDAHLYFGRKAAVEELYGKMYGQGQAAEPQLWVVAAPSGTGKSSFVKAGLTPVLKAKQGFEELLVFRPGATPARSWRLFHQNLKPEKKQILLLDQYEELFTACKDETERRLFDQKMLALLESEAFQQGNLCIFIALRSDYEWQLEASAFGQKLFERQRTAFIFRPPAMGLDELRQALTGPARAAVFDFESPALVDGILAEIANAPGALPLLSFTMSEFFQRTVKANEEILNKLEGRIFTESRYHELGGVSGALSRRADRLLEELGGEASSPTHQYFRELMIRLVDVRNGTFIRRRVYRGHMDGPAAVPDELEFDDASKNEALEVIISRLVEEQLLIASEADGKSYLEAAHDSLINYWPACLRWLEDFGEEQLVLQRRLWEATVESYREGQLYLTKREEDVSQFFSRSAELMLANLTQLWESRPELEVLKAVLENAAPGHWFNQEERCFVEASLKRRQRIVEQLKRERDEARASALSAKGLLAYPDHPTRALNLAQYAYLTLPGEEAAGAIRQITAVSHQNMYYQGHKQHQATINALALAPAGQKFASAGNDKRVILWDLGPRNSTQYTAKELVGNPAGEAVRHSSRVEALAWSPTGHYFVSGGRDNRLIVWDEDGNYLLHHDIPRTSVRRGITGLSISHDGRRMLSTGVDGMVRLWQIQLENGLPASLEQQHEEAHLTGMWISAVDFSSDGKRFVTGGGDPLPLVLWEVVEETAHSTFRRIHEFGPIDPSLVDPKARVTSVAFAPDGTHVLTSDSHFQVIAWTLDGQFQQRDVFKHHTAAVNKVRFYQGSANFISAGMDEAFVLWQQDRENGPEYVQKLAYKGHLRSIMDVVVAPEGRLIAAGEKGEVYVYDTPLYLEADIQFSGISSLKISPSGRYLSTASRITEEEQGGEESSIHQLALIDLHTKGADGKQLLLHLPHEGHVFDSCFSPDGNWLLSACMDAKVHLWAQTQANGGHEWIHKGEMPHPQAVRTVACFEAGEKLMVLTGSNTDMHLWSIEANTQSGEVALPRLLSTHSHEDLLWSIACTRDGAAIVSAGGRDATLWKAATHGEELRLEQLTLLDEHAHNIRSVAISPDGMRVLTADERQQVVLWLLKHEEGSAEVDETIFLNGHTSLNDAGHVAVSFSPDGQHILTAGQDKRAFLWDLAGNQLQVFEKPNEEANANQSISFFKALCGACFSPDGLGIYTRNIGSQAEGVSLCSWENYVKKWEAGLIYQLNEDEKRQYGMIVEKIQR